jgi:DNA-binding XRE family transcriptional regulator
MTYKPVPRDDEIRNEVLANAEAQAIYEATKLQIELAIQLKNARKKRHMTQDDVAAIMHTKKPAVSRLEMDSDDIKHSPSLLTLAKYASALGYRIKFNLEPLKKVREDHAK